MLSVAAHSPGQIKIQNTSENKEMCTSKLKTLSPFNSSFFASLSLVFSPPKDGNLCWVSERY